MGPFYIITTLSYKYLICICIFWLSTVIIQTTQQQQRYNKQLSYLGCYLRESPVRKENDPVIISGINTASAAVNTEEPLSSGKFNHPFLNEQIKSRPIHSPPSNTLLDLWYSPKLATASQNPMQCVEGCKSDYFRYAGIYKIGSSLKCLCGSSYGINGVGDCNDCDFDNSLRCGSANSASIYDTGFKVPSRPQQIMLLTRNENSLKISWVQPLATNGPLTGYNVSAKTLFSYAPGATGLPPKFWQTTDAEQETTLSGLIPGSQYSVSVTALNSEGESEPVTVTLWTKLGVPDSPSTPKVLRRDGNTMTIELKSPRNTKGPISAYRIALTDTSQSSFLSKDRSSTWKDVMNIGYSYYVAAELTPEEIPPNGRKFIVGDGKNYGGFYNGALPPGHWVPILGIISSMDGFTEMAYSSSSQTHNEDGSLKDDVLEVLETDPGILLGLWISIGISALILILCVIGFVVLKLNLLPKRRRRRRPATPIQFPFHPQENHQLQTTRDSTYIYEDDVQNGYTPNIGFVHDEDIKSKCLDKLKQVWYVPRNFVDIPSADEDAVQLFGKGRYGPVYLSSMKTDGQPVTLYTVPASSFQAGGNKQKQLIVDDPQKLYTHLDELVRIETHANIIKLIGFMEDGGSMYFVTEFGGISLKSWLLQCRQFDDPTYTEVTPYSFLLCAMNIAEAMFHLSTYKITHGQLASCNVNVSNLEQPKLTGFGLLSYNMMNEEKDYTRWAAAEQFQNRCVKPCDSWAFGILLWEIATLGGTPYHDIRTEDLAKRIGRGSRPNQTEFMGDPLYQIMLHCWQIDRDERPGFDQLSCSVHELLPYSKDNLFISPSFNYPPYIHQYEHIN